MTSSEKKFRWGVLSTAPIAASKYVPAIKASSLGKLYSVSSRSPERAQSFAEEHGFVRSHDSHEELLADPEIDGIYNPTPTALHFEWTRKCLQAGKPVLCEKPFCQTAEEVREIQALSEETGLLAMEALMMMHHPLTHKLQELVSSGAIGDLRLIENSFHAVDNPDSTRFDPELGGGALNDLGVYCIRHACLLTGEHPQNITAAGWLGPTGVDETVSMSLKFPSGCVASLNCGIRLPFACDLRVTGTKGRIEVFDGALIPFPEKSYDIHLHQQEDKQVISIPPADHYQRIADAFIRAVRGEQPPVPSLESTLATLEIMDEVRSQFSTEE